ncbi:hypothetical protein OFO07_03420 [Campylobacter sp. JMF_06 NA1]|uniref:hypothetical protein n=1 Tax=Campylobacter sp. JMF_06 NA1 TaxID=2983823 RepID=UPI0022E9AF23|nr:hypothetical protein [Campylobacter sp. JMF_06 NA1]MDA3077974.1 hypothetical protein [Campylobacter sp. JMF_06 NA1]
MKKFLLCFSILFFMLSPNLFADTIEDNLTTMKDNLITIEHCLNPENKNDERAECFLMFKLFMNENTKLPSKIDNSNILDINYLVYNISTNIMENKLNLSLSEYYDMLLYIIQNRIFSKDLNYSTIAMMSETIFNKKCSSEESIFKNDICRNLYNIAKCKIEKN